MFRRSRSFLGTVVVLCALVIFGYGLYMYDLQSMRLANVEASNRYLERDLKGLNKNIEKDEKKLKSLEAKLESEKHGLENIKGELKVESEQRQAREIELIDIGAKFTTSSNEKEKCLKEMAELKKLLENLEIEKKALTDTVGTYERAAKKAQDEIASLNSEVDQLRKDLGKASESALSNEEIEALRAEADEDKAKYHANYNDLTELREALHKVGVEGLRRDDHWTSITSEERSIILEAILGTDIIPDSYLGAEIAVVERSEDDLLENSEIKESDISENDAENQKEEAIVQVDAPSDEQLQH
ncbi:unnamed protein product [Oikopleura dioica]|uniref:Uncharacterized protein n=1 Tax=Oikopleura dioica TaxID=34765 RepID=E4X6Y4_OIKDI|nr:unnamed protein product [Oikopleura dioica]